MTIRLLFAFTALATMLAACGGIPAPSGHMPLGLN